MNFVGPVEMVSGLGRSARGYVAALEAANVPVNVIPWRAGFEAQQRLEFSRPRAALQPINLIHLNPDMSHVWLHELSNLMQPERYNIGIWYWELSSIRPEWMGLIARFDEIWCASGSMARSIGAVSPRPVRVVRPAVLSERPAGRLRRSDVGLPEQAYVFMFMCDAGSRLERKNPLALARAYLDTFKPDDGAALLLKFSYADFAPQAVRDLRAQLASRPDVVVADRILSPAELADLWRQIDCYVSPHRAEGLGLTVIEAMQAAVPVIGTPYGGVADLLSDKTGLCLDYRLAEIEETVEPYPAGFIWAEPDRASIAKHMRWAFENRRTVHYLAEAGRAAAEALFSLAATSTRLREEINRICSSPKQMPRNTVSNLPAI
ncbi:MAG TPA: glycosyltransferase family 4 protein [Hyphomicrobiaceae bacterium]|nr:glycosyltransferase family 4 protein [Hyphomicrobiaceae bacterium]